MPKNLPKIKETWKKNIKRNPNNSIKLKPILRNILKNKMRNLKLKRNNFKPFLPFKCKRWKPIRTLTLFIFNKRNKRTLLY